MPPPSEHAQLDPVTQRVLDSIESTPAAIYNSRYDPVAWNSSYAVLFPNLVKLEPARRNALWHLFTGRSCCNPFINRDQELPQMVATLRAAFGRHVGEPAWETFVRELSRVSEEFARMWAVHEVATPGVRTKIFRHPAAGLLSMATSSFAVSAMPETRLLVYTPIDEESRRRMAWLRANPSVVPECDHAS